MIFLILLSSDLLELHVAAFASLRFLADSFFEKVLLSGNSKDKLLIAISANENLISETLLLHTSPLPWDKNRLGFYLLFIIYFLQPKADR